MPPVVALAGRRVDPPDAGTPASVRERRARARRLRSFLAERQPAVLVCSAACGANDLVALEAAGTQQVRRRIILPFDPERFRETSVTDRPGDWRPLYERVVAAAGPDGRSRGARGRRRGGFHVPRGQRADPRPGAPPGRRRRGSQRRGARPVAPEVALAVIVWEGQSRGDDDATAQFATSARRRGRSGGGGPDHLSQAPWPGSR